MSTKKLLGLLFVFATIILLIFYLGKFNKINENIFSEKIIEKRVFYEMVKLYEGQKGNSISYPQLTSGSSNDVVEKVNSQIKNVISNSSCFGLPDSKESLENIKTQYYFLNGQNSNGLNYELLRNELIERFGYSSSVTSTVYLAEENLFSFSYAVEEFCGGAQPISYQNAMTFDLRTGKEILREEMLPIRNIALLENVFKYSDSVKKDNYPKCNFYDDFKDEVLSPELVFAISDNGLVLISFGYPYALSYCEPNGRIVVPFSKVSDFLSNTSVINRLVI